MRLDRRPKPDSTTRFICSAPQSTFIAHLFRDSLTITPNAEAQRKSENAEGRTQRTRKNGWLRGDGDHLIIVCVTDLSVLALSLRTPISSAPLRWVLTCVLDQEIKNETHN
jgi:hypothetical protein